MQNNDIQKDEQTTQYYSNLEKSFISHGYRKISIAELHYPMDILVPELMDKNNIENSFHIFSFLSPDDRELLESLNVKHVWILKNAVIPKKPEQAKNPQQTPIQRFEEVRAQKNPEKKVYEPLVSELAKSKNFFKESYQQTRAALDSIRQTGILNIDGVTQVVDDITSSVARNPSTLLCMRGLQSADQYTYFHSINVALFASIFAQHLGYSEEEVWCIGFAGILHDIGKQKIPLTVLNASRKLTDDEFTIMKQHPQFAHDILKKGDSLAQGIIEGVYCHHEKFDGSGYPNNLKGDEIHPYAAILSLADIYDALTSERPYKRAFPQNKTASIIFSLRGTSFDADMVDQFIGCFGVYPIGCLVRLNTGEYGIVYENNDDDLLHPKILRLATNYNKILASGARPLDLRKFTSSIQIVSCEDIKKFNLDLEKILLAVS